MNAEILRHVDAYGATVMGITQSGKLAVIQQDTSNFRGGVNATLPAGSFVLRNAIVSLCVSGMARARVDGRAVEMRAGDLAMVHPGHMVGLDEMSDDFVAIHVVLERDTAARLWQMSSLAMQLRFARQSVLHLTPDEAQTLAHGLHMLTHIVSHPGNNQRHLVQRSLEAMLQMVQEFDSLRHLDHDAASQRHAELFERFYDLILHNHRAKRRIIDYAHSLCLTPKYLSAVIKQVSGKGAGEWIDECVVNDARATLMSRPDLTVQQVAGELGFPDQASFSKFFKRHTGLTPTQYRATR